MTATTLRKFWDRLWFQPADPLPLGMFRISLGIFLAALFLALYPNWQAYYGADGIASMNDPTIGHTVQRWCLFYWTEGLIPFRVFWWVGFLSALGFAAGWRTRTMTVILYVIQSSLTTRHGMVLSGEDWVCRMLLFYSLFAPLGHSLSLDSRFRKTPRPWPAVWPMRLIQIDVALLYAFTALSKVSCDISWRNGDAVYWALTGEPFTRWPWPKLLYEAWITKLLTFGTVFVEAGFPIFVWFKKPRLFFVIAAAGLQMGIAVFMQNVTFFAFAVLCPLWTFIPAETLREWGLKIREELRKFGLVFPPAKSCKS